jgi:hypothetical protein
MSSQYGTDSWAAMQVLGPPNVFPRSGDDVNAWASAGADTGVEFLEVELVEPHRLSGVDVFETYNPGAVTRIELIDAEGVRHEVYQASAAVLGQPAHARKVDFDCTAFEVTAIRVTIDSGAVPGWNEIDAIGGRLCE